MKKGRQLHICKSDQIHGCQTAAPLQVVLGYLDQCSVLFRLKRVIRLHLQLQLESFHGEARYLGITLSGIPARSPGTLKLEAC